MTRYVAIVGKFTHEGITTALKSRDLEARHVNLYRVSVKTWVKKIEEIRALRDSKRLAAIVLHFPSAMIIDAANQKYREVFVDLIKEASLTRCVAFVFAENLNLNFRPRSSVTNEYMTDSDLESLAGDEYEGSRIWEWRHEAIKKAEANIDVISNLFSDLYNHNIEISPFYRRDDITVKLNDFLDEVDKDIFLRMYVPNQRFQADQLESLLRTFERYLRQVEDKKFRIETRATGTGTLYTFCGSDRRESFHDLEEAFQRFDEFMKLCRDDPERAVEFLKVPGLSAPELRFTIAKYARDYQRIMLDVKHEFQQKMLMLSQKFDIDVLNASQEAVSADALKRGPSVLLDLSGNTGSLSLNIGSLGGVVNSSTSQSIGSVINSGIIYNEKDQKVLDIISDNANRVDAIQLRSDLDQIKTNEIPESERKVSKGRIVSFLYKVMSRSGDKIMSKSISDLIDYVQNLLL